MGVTKRKTKSSIPTGMHAFMTWLANYLAQINAFIAGPNAPDGYPYFYPRAINRWTTKVVPAITNLQTEFTPVSTKGTHTSAQTKQFDADRKTFLSTLLRPFNAEFVTKNSAFNVNNRATIGILPVASTARTAAGTTVEQFFATFKSLGSCVYEIHGKLTADATKGGTPDGKITQMSYSIVARVAAGAVQPAPPAGPSECTTQDVNTHALFTKDFEIENAGKILYIYFRWFDLHNQEKSGPWSILYTINLA